MEQASIEVLEDGIRIVSLDILRKGVAEFLRPVPDDEREGRVVEALETGVFCLERASSVRDLDFVRSQVDGMLDHIERGISDLPAIVEKDLAGRLGADDGQVLAPFRTHVDATSRTLTERVNDVRDLLKEVDPERSTSTLGRALNQLKDLLDPRRSDSVQGSLAEAVRDITGEDGRLAKAVASKVDEAVRPLKEAISRLERQSAAAEAVEEALSGTTKKGSPYEEEVLGEVLTWSKAMGAAVRHVGPDNRPGDVVVTFGDASVASGLRVVIEARDRASSPVGRKAIADIAEKAMAEREANAAIYVSRSRDGLAKEVGEWAEGECDRGPWIGVAHEHLFVAFRFSLLLYRLAGIQEAQPAVDFSAIRGQVERIRIALRRVATIKSSATKIRDSAGKVDEEAEMLQSDIRRALLAIEEALRLCDDEG